MAMSSRETDVNEISSNEFGFSVMIQDNNGHISSIKTQVRRSNTEIVPRESASRQRVLRELQILDWSTIDGITAYAEDLSNIRAFISGPVDSPYEGISNVNSLTSVVGGIFELEIVIPDDYPLQEPNYKFITAIYHPWINDHGKLCMQGPSLLSPYDPDIRCLGSRDDNSKTFALYSVNTL